MVGLVAPHSESSEAGMDQGRLPPLVFLPAATEVAVGRCVGVCPFTRSLDHLVARSGVDERAVQVGR